MKKKMLNFVLLVVMIFVVGCNSSTSVGDFETSTPIRSANQENCNTYANNSEYNNAQSDTVSHSTDVLNERVYNLKSVSVFIASQNEDYNEISSLSMTYISIKLEDDSNLGTDTLKRESLIPRKITGFGEVTKINYFEFNPVVANKTKLSVKVELDGFNTNKILEKEEVIDMRMSGVENNILVSELILDNQSGLKLVFKAEIESIEN